VSPDGLILGIDPGRSKAGFALLRADGGVIARGIEPLEALRERLSDIVAAGAVAVIALGRGTNAKAVKALLDGLGPPIVWVDEFETSRLARSLFFVDHPPRGWRRLIPIGMQLPDRPVDDYAAIAIGRRFLRSS
jgi:RNase H-fold protein (predicted Holliday junction resolvase)